jgi:hypothetical protein
MTYGELGRTPIDILCTSNQLFAAMPWYIELIFNTKVIQDTEQRLEEKNSHTR